MEFLKRRRRSASATAESTAEAKDAAPPPPSIPLPSRTYGFPPEAFDWSRLPDVDTNFLPAEDIEAFIQALAAPDPIPQSPDDAAGASTFRLNSPVLHKGSAAFDFEPGSRRAASSLSLSDETGGSNLAAPVPLRPAAATPSAIMSRRSSSSSMFITAQNDWAPVNEKVIRDKEPKTKEKTKKQGGKGPGRTQARSKDETREGYFYSLLKWPFLLIVIAWITGLSVAYLATRTYIYLYEQFIAWRGQRERLRRAMRATSRYADWVAAARKMDDFLGNAKWKEVDDFAYYDSGTVRRVLGQMKKCRRLAEKSGDKAAVEDLKVLIEACVKNNWVGVENPRLYSQTYYGTKNLVQNFIDEGEFLFFLLVLGFGVRNAVG